MKGTISQVLNQCLREFTALTDSDILNRYETEVSHRRWLDELGRLRVWSGNIGAHQVGQSSLDYRLRDASHLKGETIKLLGRMLRVLHEVVEVIEEGSGEEPEIQVDDDSQEDDTTEVQQLHQSVVDIINSLFQISMVIRRPADHDRVLNVRIKDELYFEPWARQHVSDKYPNAEDSVISRLSAALSRQRAILKYRERHKAKLEKGLFERIETESTKLSETVATEMAPENDQLYFLERQSNSGISQTSYATSLMATKAATSIPNPPKGSENSAPFECPYCFYVITIKHKRDWVQHVFRDLMPYVCLASNCTTPLRLYESRHQWALHIYDAHPGTRRAPHSSQCPLCHVNVEPSSFEKHVGRHLEELALFILPQPEVTEETISESSSLAESESVTDNANDPGFLGTSEAESLFDLSSWAEQSVGELEDFLTASEEEQDPEFDAIYGSQQPRLDIDSEGGSEGGVLPSNYPTPLDSPSTRAYEPSGSVPPIQDDLSITSTGTFKCTYSGCTAPPFQTKYLLKSHLNVHLQERPYFCPVEGCARGPGGLGFKRKSEIMRHGIVHGNPGYICPFCPGSQGRYTRPDRLIRHVRVDHRDKNRDDPDLRRALLGKNIPRRKAISTGELKEMPETSANNIELLRPVNSDKSEKSIAEGRTQSTAPNPDSEKPLQTLGAEAIQQLEAQEAKE